MLIDVITSIRLKYFFLNQFIDLKHMDRDSCDRLANKVRIIRGKLKQTELATILDVSPGSVSGWENGKNIPTIENLEKLAELSNQLPEEFLAEIYGRQISTKPEPELEEQLKRLSAKRLISLLATIAALLAGSVIVDEVADIKDLYERELTHTFKSPKSKK